VSVAKVTFLPENRTVEIETGATISEAARQANIPLTSPCAGAGTCGRCRVLLPDAGSVLACRQEITEDTVVEIPITSRLGGLVVHLTSSIESSSIDRPLDPLTSKPPSDGPSYGLALDIGTSTLAAEWVDSRSGQVLVRAGRANSQAAFGAEVTRRIEHVEDHGPEDLAEAIGNDIQALVTRMSEDLEVEAELDTIVVAGNTGMLHFLYRYDPGPIRRAPHVPSVAAPPSVCSSALGLELRADPRIHAFPSIGGWVGGDITAGILATGMHRDDALTLLIDIGTNGEIVLGNREWMMACAASAGPAFEGTGITCGSSATPGAIDCAAVNEDGCITCTTIDDEPHHGICGSGLISVVANLFRAGLIDRAGQILSPEPCCGEPGYVLIPADHSATGRTIGVAQRDIDSVLRAKAAVFAGVQSLLASAGLSASDVERLIICGGFGSVLRPVDAVSLGLVPDLPEDRITFAGNTALRGARTALLSKTAWAEAQEIARTTTYVELIDQADYFEAFTSAQFIPHTDLSLFPSVSAPTQRTGRS